MKAGTAFQTSEQNSIEQDIVSGASWERFCDQLKQAGLQVLRPETPSDPFNRAEGFRYLTRLTRIALEMHMESGDRAFPTFYRPSHETAKIGADNPDNYYQRAEVSGQYDYRIRGTRGTVHYLGFVTLRGGYGTNGKNEQTGDIDHHTLQLEEDGSFEIIASRHPHPGNWLPMTEDSNTLLVRQTFLDRSRERIAEISIERINAEQATPEPLDPVEFDRRLRVAAGFVEGCAKVFCDWSEEFKKRPNELPIQDQSVFQNAGGDPNIFYFHGYWELQPDEALVVELDEIPPCDTWNLQLNNYWMESLDYRYHSACFNKYNAKPGADGRIRIIIAHQNPGRDNWLDTAGHQLGTMCFRWIRAEQHPQPSCRLVKLSELNDL